MNETPKDLGLGIWGEDVIAVSYQAVPGLMAWKMSGSVCFFYFALKIFSDRQENFSY